MVSPIPNFQLGISNFIVFLGNLTTNIASKYLHSKYLPQILLRCTIRHDINSNHKLSKTNGAISVSVIPENMFYKQLLTHLSNDKGQKILKAFLLVFYPVRDIKPPNNQFCFPTIFSANFFQLAQLKKKTNFFVVWQFDATDKIFNPSKTRTNFCFFNLKQLLNRKNFKFELCYLSFHCL